VPSATHRREEYPPVDGRRRPWAMLIRAALSQNVAIGCAFGGFSVSVLALQERYQSTRAEASMGLALVVLVMGLVGPLAAAAIGRIGLRATMLAGATLSALGYLAVAFAPNMMTALAAYALLVGPGIALFGPLPASMLAGDWFPGGRGRAVGLANMPVLVAVIPLIGLTVISRYGLPAFYMCLAAIHILLMPVLFGVADAPSSGNGLDAEGDQPVRDVSGGGAVPLLTRPAFWLMVLGGGLLSATAITSISHIVALGIEKGLTPQSATLLVSVMGGASIVGSVLVGFLCDKLGGARALAVAAFGFALSWVAVLASGSFMVMAPAMLVMGASGAGIVPIVSVLIAHFFGTASIARGFGYFGLFTLPLTFLLPPAAGALRDAAGNYTAVMLAIIIGCGLVGVLFVAIAGIEGRRMRTMSREAAALG